MSFAEFWTGYFEQVFLKGGGWGSGEEVWGIFDIKELLKFTLQLCALPYKSYPIGVENIIHVPP